MSGKDDMRKVHLFKRLRGNAEDYLPDNPTRWDRIKLELQLHLYIVVWTVITVGGVVAWLKVSSYLMGQ